MPTKLNKSIVSPYRQHTVLNVASKVCLIVKIWARVWAATNTTDCILGTSNYFCSGQWNSNGLFSTSLAFFSVLISSRNTNTCSLQTSSKTCTVHTHKLYILGELENFSRFFAKVVVLQSLIL